MNRERTDPVVPGGTVDRPDDEPDEGSAAIELGPGGQPPVSLDPDRDTAERNAAAGGWDGANEQIENDFEVEQLRRKSDAGSDDEDVPLT